MGGIQTKLTGLAEAVIGSHTFKFEVSFQHNRASSAENTMNAPVVASPREARMVATDEVQSPPITSICSVCLENFRRPIKILGCGHSFCLRCLIGWQRTRATFEYLGHVNCPLCRRLSVVPEGQVDRLATNIVLEEVLAGMGCIDDGTREEIDGHTMHEPMAADGLMVRGNNTSEDSVDSAVSTLSHSPSSRSSASSSSSSLPTTGTTISEVYRMLVATLRESQPSGTTAGAEPNE